MSRPPPPRICILGGGTVSFEGTPRNAGQLGVTEAFASLARLRMAQGRFISRHDRFEPFVVIGADLAEGLSTPFARIRPGSAIRLGRYFGTDPLFWLNMQTAHDLSKAEAETDYSDVPTRAA